MVFCLYETYEFMPSLQKSRFFENYELDLKEKILGDGSSSVCRKCTNRQTRKEFAVKIVNRKIDCMQEIRLLRICQGHPNIVSLHEVYYDEVSV
jgi:ribosomal protein S6 kinase alpha-5